MLPREVSLCITCNWRPVNSAHPARYRKSQYPPRTNYVAVVVLLCISGTTKQRWNLRGTSRPLLTLSSRSHRLERVSCASANRCRPGNRHVLPFSPQLREYYTHQEYIAVCRSGVCAVSCCLHVCHIREAYCPLQKREAGVFRANLRKEKKSAASAVCACLNTCMQTFASFVAFQGPPI